MMWVGGDTAPEPGPELKDSDFLETAWHFDLLWGRVNWSELSILPLPRGLVFMMFCGGEFRAKAHPPGTAVPFILPPGQGSQAAQGVWWGRLLHGAHP